MYRSELTANPSQKTHGFIVRDEDGDACHEEGGFPTPLAAQAAATKKVAELKMADRFD